MNLAQNDQGGANVSFNGGHFAIGLVCKRAGSYHATSVRCLGPVTRAGLRTNRKDKA